MIYYKQEKFSLAEMHFQKALDINPQSSVLLCHIGVVSSFLSIVQLVSWNIFVVDLTAVMKIRAFCYCCYSWNSSPDSFTAKNSTFLLDIKRNHWSTLIPWASYLISLSVYFMNDKKYHLAYLKGYHKTHMRYFIFLKAVYYVNI